MSEIIELLFFDTFAHENSEELNLDLVQFPKPVFVTEVRIIPLGARVQADFPGGVRLGATNPSKFNVEFFVNDLGKPGASTFETLGGFEYDQNGCINLNCVPDNKARKIPTDGLVLRGWYSTITLAVYGTLTANIAEQSASPVVPSSIPSQTNIISEVQQIISGTPIKSEWPLDTTPTIEYNQGSQSSTNYPQTYPSTEPYSQEYSDYYNGIPKDPRSYHHTPESDWDNKNRRSIEPDRDRDRERNRDTYPKGVNLDRDHHGEEPLRSRSRDRQTSRDRDWDQDYRERDRERDRSYKRNRSYEREERKRPRTSPKRPRTPQPDRKEQLSPVTAETVTEEREIEKKGATADAESLIKEEAVKMDVEEFEPILSDEDILDDGDHYPDIDYDYHSYTNNDDLIKFFVPGVNELKKYDEREKPFEVEDGKFRISETMKTAIGIADDFFKSSITKYTIDNFEKLNKEIKEEFVHLCDRIYINVDNFQIIIQIYALFMKGKIQHVRDEDKEIISQVQNITETMVDWLRIALSFEMVNEQEQPGYKIRHIKSGIRLVEWCCRSEEFLEILWENNLIVHNILLELYEQEHMALSIKLMILKALDAYLMNKRVVEYFLGRKFEAKPKENGFYQHSACDSNGYKTLINFLLRNPSVRLKFALNSLLKKIHIFEALAKLRNSVENLLTQRGRGNSEDDDIHFTEKALEHILNACRAGCFVLSQPKRFLPVPTQFEINRNETRNVLIELFDMFNFLEFLTALLTLPETMNLPFIKSSVYEIISHLLQSSEGLQYMSRNSNTVNLLLKCLLRTEEVIHFQINNTCHLLGLEVAFKLQCLYHVEKLMVLGPKFKYDPDYPEIIEELHALFCLTFSGPGKFACAEILSIGDNIKCLLQFIDVGPSKDKDCHLSRFKKSPGIGYIIDLIALTVTSANNIIFLETYSKQLLNIVSQRDIFDVSATMKLNDIASYLKPTENRNFGNYDNISSLVECIDKSLESITSYPGQLITSLRVIRHLGIPKLSPESAAFDGYVELKYKHVILQLFSLDGISLLSKILQKICDHYEQPALHSYVFASTQSINVVNVVGPTVELLKQMLTYVVQCRNILFKDLTSVPVLLQTYNLLHAFPITSPVISDAMKIRKCIVETLLVYTQPVSEEVHEKDSLNKTLWTLMCGEVIKFMLTAPYTFISGLLILSELLPLPLPIQSREELSKQECTWLINLRKLWSAHLHSHSSSIQDLINRLCLTSHQPLLNLVRRLCVQLSDLAATTAITIARGILDTVCAALDTEGGDPNLPRLMNFLACLVTHSPLKCAVLQLVHNCYVSPKTDRYATMIKSFVQMLNTKDSGTSQIQIQECVLSIFQSLCDSENTLLQSREGTELTSEVYLANALPMKELFVTFLKSMVDHLQGANTFVTYLSTVRTFLLLTEHNYGFYHMREVLVGTNEPFLNLTRKLLENFSKENIECLSTLNTLVEFLRVCSTVEDMEGSVMLHQPRDIKMSLAQVRSLVGWKVYDGSGDVTDHPFLALEQLVKKTAKDDTTFESLADSLTDFVKLLNGQQNEMRDNVSEPILPMPEPLLVQFSGRQIFTKTETAEERLNSSFWLGIPTDDSESDPENIHCDLTEICRQHLPAEMNLIRQVEKLCRICPSDENDAVPKDKSMEMQEDKIKRPFVTPIRGRGFVRANIQRADLFRSRPPNTSRPPSVHVDDFVALETCGAQPTGPTGYNKISRELLATTRVARGVRGRAFMTSERAVQYRQMNWWSAGMGRGPYQ